MALNGIGRELSDILFVVVTCTRDPSRERALRCLIKSLNEQHRRVGFHENLLLFDNASTLQAPLSTCNAPARFAMCGKNVGYWSALKWAMDNAAGIFGRQFKYIHPIESDLVLYRLERLTEAKRFLDRDAQINTVRTQEFSVAHQDRYFKGRRHFFRRRRSLVADYNGVTGEKVTFEKVGGFDRIYLTNWHAKVPALHRMAALKSAFQKLERMETLTEFFFMQTMHEKSNRVAVLDKGIYYTLSYRPSRTQISGSYTDVDMLAKLGYRQSRFDRMVTETFDVRVGKQAAVTGNR